MSAPASTLFRSAPQRARLERLHDEADPLIEEERRQAIRDLLREPLLLAQGADPSAFGRVRRHGAWLADWFAHYADWTLSVTPEAARLRKYPANLDDGTRGLTALNSGEPFTRPRYVLFCLTLAALERGGRQITLGRLAEQTGLLWAAEPALAAHGLTWSLDTAGGRRDYVQVLRFLVEAGLLSRLQGTEEQLLQDRQADALYNINRAVLPLLLAVRRSPSLVTGSNFVERLRAIAETPRPDTPEARNRALRTGWVRRLLDDPVTYHDRLGEEERSYFESQRAHLVRETCGATGLVEEARAEGIALADLEGDCTDTGLPEEGTEGHLTLLLATWMAERLRRGQPGPLDVAAVRDQAARFMRAHRHHWSKAAAEEGASEWLTDLVLDRLAGLGLVALENGAVTPQPALGRFALRSTPEMDAAPEESARDFPT